MKYMLLTCRRFNLAINSCKEIKLRKLKNSKNCLFVSMAFLCRYTKMSLCKDINVFDDA